MKSNRTKFRVIAALCLLLGLLLLTGEDTGADTEGGASVAGVVSFDGPKPRRTKIVMLGNKADRNGGSANECIKLHGDKTPLSEHALVSDAGGLANAFVYVRKGLEKKKKYPMPKTAAMISQKDCMFRPRVQGVRVGQELLLRNSDGLVHNVRAYASRNRPFNIAQPADSADRKKVFTRPERALQIGCDIHRWMKAFVFVMDHPYYAVTDADGKFTIKGLPAGEYTLEVWHEDFGKRQATFTVNANGSSKVDFSFQPKTKKGNA